MEAVIQKGSRIRAEWFSSNMKDTALSGTQLKTVASAHSIIGTVRHIRSNDPDFNPANVVVFVEPDDGQTGELCHKCGVNEVEIKTAWIIEVIKV